MNIIPINTNYPVRTGIQLNQSPLKLVEKTFIPKK